MSEFGYKIINKKAVNRSGDFMTLVRYEINNIKI